MILLLSHLEWILFFGKVVWFKVLVNLSFSLGTFTTNAIDYNT